MNEVSKVHRILFSATMMRAILQIEAFYANKFEHAVDQLVDDSNSVIIITDRNKKLLYLNNYFLILKIFYNLNILQINDKAAKGTIKTVLKMAKQSYEISLGTNLELKIMFS